MGDPVVQLGKGALDTFNRPIVPIVFVPGVMGSRLSMPSGTDWDPDDPAAMLAGADVDTKLRDLNVFNRPVAKVIRPFSSAGAAIVNGSVALSKIASRLRPGLTPSVLYAERGWGGAVFAFYNEILTLLETQFNKAFFAQPPHPVFCFGYDWRRSNVDSGRALRARIEEIIKQTPDAKEVVVVTHGMGGLVARAMLALTGEDKVAAVIHGAQPSNGTPVAYRRFFTGATPPFEGNAVPDQVLNNIMGTSPIEYTTVQSGLPGPVQLMPNQLYHKTSGSQWLVLPPGSPALDNVYDIYRQTNAPGVFRDISAFPNLSGVFVQANLANVVEEARSFHAMLGTTCHSKTHVIFSDQLATDVIFDTTKPALALGSKVIKAPAGDGTVAAVSGSCPDLPAARVKSRRSIPNLEHSQVYADATFNAHVVTLLGAIFGDVVGPISPVKR